MSKADKASIGTAPCPIKGCVEVVPVFKYEGASDPARRRFAGRMYCRCSTHGRVENQEYLLENLTWHDASKSEKTTGNDASNASRPDPITQRPAPTAKQSAAPTQRPAPMPAATPASKSEPEAPKSSGWLPEFFK